MNRYKILEYYSREDIANSIIAHAKDKEIAGVFINGSYDKRPNMVQFPTDVIQMAKRGVTSFHLSVERWKNPMGLINTQNYEKLRTGWDIVIDIDSKLDLGASQLTASMICNFLKKFGVHNYGIKFSGRRGFHISLPWEMFPKKIDYKPLEKLYPIIPRIVINFIRSRLSQDLMKEIIKRKEAQKLIEALEEPPSELNPFYFVEVENNWGSRHMFRAPYSLNEKTWLASIPIKTSVLKSFKSEYAEPRKIHDIKPFFYTTQENEAENLLIEAMDWAVHMQKKEPEKRHEKRIVWEKKVHEETFPPCIKIILNGINDGKKRSLFTLINFLRMMNWGRQEIEEKIFEWNAKNKSSLPRNYVIAQLRYSQQRMMNPANCDANMYFTDISICKPDNICKGNTREIVIKNPISYPFKKMKITTKNVKKRGFSCGACKQEFKTMRGLNMHKGRYH